MAFRADSGLFKAESGLFKAESGLFEADLESEAAVAGAGYDLFILLKSSLVIRPSGGGV